MMKKPIIRWVVYHGNKHPMTIGYTRKQAVALFMRMVGPNYTWEKMKLGGYTVQKSEIKPLINESMGE